MTASDRWLEFLTGPIQFDESEEYLAFRFRMLAALALAGVLATLLFIAGEASGANPIDLRHQRMMVIFTLGSLLLWSLLRGHKQRFRVVAWVYVTVPATYLILGRRAGLAVALLCFAGLVALNPVLERPYSPNAMATALAALAYLSFLFHVHNARAVSYFKRMREYNAHLQERASIDPLTGVMNARAYYAACEHWLDGARGAECTVLFVDLDHFKRVNDEHGHAAGDAVLQAVAAALQAGLRRSDLLGRIGGEEFSVFLPFTGSDQAALLAEKLRGTIAALAAQTPAGPLHITASIGVAGRQLPEDTMADIQRRADTAMYQAKAAGRNRVSRL